MASAQYFMRKQDFPRARMAFRVPICPLRYHHALTFLGMPYEI
jgi:hypothetical protein